MLTFLKKSTANDRTLQCDLLEDDDFAFLEQLKAEAETPLLPSSQSNAAHQRWQHLLARYKNDRDRVNSCSPTTRFNLTSAAEWRPSVRAINSLNCGRRDQSVCGLRSAVYRTVAFATLRALLPM
jgi:hypothetical protein